MSRGCEDPESISLFLCLEWLQRVGPGITINWGSATRVAELLYRYAVSNIQEGRV